MTSQNDTTFLQRAIQADGIYCAVNGFLFAIFAAPIGNWLGITLTLSIILLGIGLVIYGLGLVYLARRGVATPVLGVATLAGNLCWIGGSVLLLAMGWLPILPAGRWLIILVAVGVAIFGVFQALAIWRYRGQQSAVTV